MINVYKSPISKEKYANLFLDKIPEGVKNVCLLFIGHSETVHYIMSQKSEIQFTVIDGADVTEALPYIYNGANLKESITFEDSWCEDETFLKKLKASFENYNINNMSFDFIIANPPYGYKGNLAKDIIREICDHSNFEEFVCLATLLAFRKANEHVVEGSIRKVEGQVFEGAAIQGLALAKIRKESIRKDKITCIRESLDGKQLQLFNAVQSYNKKHACVWIGLGTKKPIKSNLKYRDRMFAATWWTPNNGVHSDKDSIDQQFNLYNADLDSLGKSILAFLWPTKVERDNFCNWWYSCLQNGTYGLTNTILDVMDVNFGSTGVENFKILFPNLDWSHPWTDKEILKEIGLPEDFLEREC